MKKAIVLAVFLALFVPSSAFAATREEQIASLWKQIYALQAQIMELQEREQGKKIELRREEAKESELPSFGCTYQYVPRLSKHDLFNKCVSIGG